MTAGPAPDPGPGARPGHIRYVDAAVVVEAIAVDGGAAIPGWWFRCRLPARWHGRPNTGSHLDRCVLFHR